MAKNSKKNSKQTIIALILCFVILLGGGILTYFWTHKPKLEIHNPDGTVGNSAGNLNNYGLFCEYGGKVYFSNSFDGGALYCMNVDESDIRHVSTSIAQTILAGGDYLYFFQSGIAGNGDISNIVSRHGFFRCDLAGKNITSLSEEVIVTGQLVGDYLYLLSVNTDTINFFKTRCDKSDTVSLANYSINPACVKGTTIYYNGTQDNHYLYSLDTRNDIPHEVESISLWYPVIDGDYLYYMDVPNNYRLCRYNMSTREIEILTKDRVDCFNVGGGYVYYQKNGTDPQLICMRADGTDVRIIANGNFTRINMTSKYVYFQEFESRTQYHCPIGSTSYTLFTAAQNAVPEKKK